MLKVATDQRQPLSQADQAGSRPRLGQDGSPRSVRASRCTPGIGGSHRRRRTTGVRRLTISATSPACAVPVTVTSTMAPGACLRALVSPS